MSAARRPVHTAGGFRKRVLYLAPDALGEDRVGAAVNHPAFDDPALRHRRSATRPLADRLRELLDAPHR